MRRTLGCPSKACLRCGSWSCRRGRTYSLRMRLHRPFRRGVSGGLRGMSCCHGARPRRPCSPLSAQHAIRRAGVSSYSHEQQALQQVPVHAPGTTSARMRVWASAHFRGEAVASGGRRRAALDAAAQRTCDAVADARHLDWGRFQRRRRRRERARRQRHAVSDSAARSCHRGWSRAHERERERKRERERERQVALASARVRVRVRRRVRGLSPPPHRARAPPVACAVAPRPATCAWMGHRGQRRFECWPLRNDQAEYYRGGASQLAPRLGLRRRPLIGCRA